MWPNSRKATLVDGVTTVGAGARRPTPSRIMNLSVSPPRTVGKVQHPTRSSDRTADVAEALAPDEWTRARPHRGPGSNAGRGGTRTASDGS